MHNQSEMERLRQSNTELLQDTERCRKREADMLEFTQKLTAKNVRLQSEFTAVEAKVRNAFLCQCFISFSFKATIK